MSVPELPFGAAFCFVYVCVFEEIEVKGDSLWALILKLLARYTLT